MDPKPRRQKDREGVISALNAAIDALNIVETSSIAPAKAVFGSVNVILTIIKIRFPALPQ